MTSPPRWGTRDRYLDVLRGSALIRVIVYHAFPAVWLTYLPALGVMFALGGSLMARSVDRSTGAKAVRSRLRRLLPSFWLLGAIVVPIMIWHGWSPTSDDETPLRWWELGFWILPVGNPTGSDWAVAAWEVLWYVKTYLLFVLVSPVALRAFRRAPLLVLAVPLVAAVVLDRGWVDIGGPVGDDLFDMASFGTCWLLGFAHHDRLLDRFSRAFSVAFAAVAIAAGTTWSLLLPTDPGNLELDSSPVGMALVGMGTVFLLLRFRPTMSWLATRRLLDRFVTVLNARALTVYLWHNIAIALAVPLADYLGVDNWDWEWFLASLLLTFVAMLAFGWVEDLAARRRPQLLPGGDASGGRSTEPTTADEPAEATGPQR